MMRTATSRLAKLYTYTPGVSKNLYTPTSEPRAAKVSESEWVELLHNTFGAPLVNYYKSRYPSVTREDVEKIRGELRASFHVKDDWQARYKQLKMPEEMFRVRTRLEAELDPTNVEKLKAIDHDDHQSADAYASLRLKVLQEEQKFQNDIKVLNAARGQLTSPNVDWDQELSTSPHHYVRERRARYERLANTTVHWEDDLPTKWAKIYGESSEELQKDIDIDYLRYLEGHIRDQFRAEKWYQRLAEDGESTLTYEEVEAWMPEYYDTLMVDYDNWWELVSRGTDASQWDKFLQTDDAYHQSLQQRHTSVKQLLQDSDDVINRHFAPQSLFETFRNVPEVSPDFRRAAGVS